SSRLGAGSGAGTRGPLAKGCQPTECRLAAGCFPGPIDFHWFKKTEADSCLEEPAGPVAEASASASASPYRTVQFGHCSSKALTPWAVTAVSIRLTPSRVGRF